MKTAPHTPTDELFKLERKIARRADQLVRKFGFDRAHSLDPWRQAEREVWRASPQAGGFPPFAVGGRP